MLIAQMWSRNSRLAELLPDHGILTRKITRFRARGISFSACVWGRFSELESVIIRRPVKRSVDDGKGAREEIRPLSLFLSRAEGRGIGVRWLYLKFTMTRDT